MQNYCFHYAYTKFSSLAHEEAELFAVAHERMFEPEYLSAFTKHQYAYAAYIVGAPFDMRTYFAATDKLLHCGDTILELPVDLAVRTLEFLREFDFTEIYVSPTTAQQIRLEHLEKCRVDAIRVLFEIYPTCVSWAARVVPTRANIWNPKISKAIVPGLTDPVFCTRDQFTDRFQQLTCGILTNFMERPEAANIIVAGGSIAKILAPQVDLASPLMKSTDIDIFIFSATNETCTEVLSELLRYFDAMGNVYYAIMGSVVNVYFRGVKRKFQIVCSGAKTPADILCRFDVGHVQVGVLLSSGKVVASAAGLVSHKDGVSRIVQRQRTNMLRLTKALIAGFRVEQDGSEVAGLLSVSISDANLSDPTSQISKLIVELHKYYYIGIDNDDEDNIHASIRADSKTTLSFCNRKDVLNNINISTTFESAYMGQSFADFKLSHVSIQHKSARKNSVTLTVMTEKSAAKIVSNVLIVANKVVDELYVTIHVIPDDKFADFLRMLEDNLWRMYSHQQITDKVVKKGLIQLTKKETPGRAYIRDQRGKPLTNAELAVGDKINVVFGIQLTIGVDKKYGIVLCPHNIIKNCDYTDESPKEEIPFVAPKESSAIEWVIE